MSQFIEMTLVSCSAVPDFFANTIKVLHTHLDKGHPLYTYIAHTAYK